jgi:hypothetical protein
MTEEILTMGLRFSYLAIMCKVLGFNNVVLSVQRSFCGLQTLCYLFVNHTSISAAVWVTEILILSVDYHYPFEVR